MVAIVVADKKPKKKGDRRAKPGRKRASSNPKAGGTPAGAAGKQRKKKRDLKARYVEQKKSQQRWDKKARELAFLNGFKHRGVLHLTPAGLKRRIQKKMQAAVWARAQAKLQAQAREKAEGAQPSRRRRGRATRGRSAKRKARAEWEARPRVRREAPLPVVGQLDGLEKGLARACRAIASFCQSRPHQDQSNVMLHWTFDRPRKETQLNPHKGKQRFWSLRHALYHGEDTAIFLTSATKRQVGARLTQHGIQVYDVRKLIKRVRGDKALHSRLMETDFLLAERSAFAHLPSELQRKVAMRVRYFGKMRRGQEEFVNGVVQLLRGSTAVAKNRHMKMCVGRTMMDANQLSENIAHLLAAIFRDHPNISRSIVQLWLRCQGSVPVTIWERSPEAAAQSQRRSKTKERAQKTKRPGKQQEAMQLGRPRGGKGSTARPMGPTSSSMHTAGKHARRPASVAKAPRPANAEKQDNGRPAKPSWTTPTPTIARLMSATEHLRPSGASQGTEALYTLGRILS